MHFQPVEKTCQQCGKIFRVTRKRDAERIYCSASCYHTYEHEHGKPDQVVPRIIFNCASCGKPFGFEPGQLTSYRKQHGKDPKYCSMPCSDKGRRADSRERNTFTCENCGATKSTEYENSPATRTRYHYKRRFCDRKCKNEWLRKNAADRFQRGEIGRHVKRHGYVWISIPANLTTTGVKREMLEHRYIMEQALGRPLTDEETVHHKNGQRADNRLENLDLRSGNHGPGGDVSAMIRWAHAFIARYPQFDAEGRLHPVSEPPIEHT